MGRKPKGRAPFGFQFSDEGTLVHHPRNAPVVRLIFDLFVEHRVKSKVAELLNEMGHKTANGSDWTDVQVDRVLKHTSARGFYATNTSRLAESGKREPRPESEWIIIPVDPIVSEELFEKAESILSNKPGSPAGTVARKSEQTFTDLAFCSCGGKMRVPPNNPRYVCPNCHFKISVIDLENHFAQDLITYLLEDDDTPADGVVGLGDRWLDLEPAVRRDIALTYLDRLTVDKQAIQFVYQFPSSLKDATTIQHTEPSTNNVPTDNLDPNEPRYIRLPRSGETCPHSGLKRSVLYKLISPFREDGGSPTVDSVSVKKPGQTRGARLIVWASLKAYLEGRGGG